MCIHARVRSWRIVSATWRRPVQASAKHLNLPALMPAQSAANHRFIEATINPSATESPYLADIYIYMYIRTRVYTREVSAWCHSFPSPRNSVLGKVYGDVLNGTCAILLSSAPRKWCSLSLDERISSGRFAEFLRGTMRFGVYLRLYSSKRTKYV